MIKRNFRVQGKVWIYPGMAGWHFVSVPKQDSAEIKKLFGAKARGWGSVPVEVTVGTTSWRTSIFPDKKSGVYFLPLKAQVRKKEHIYAEGIINFVIRIV